MKPDTPVSQETLAIDTEVQFLDVWKIAVYEAGSSRFTCKNDELLYRITHWRQAAPDLKLIRQAIPNLEQGHAAFLACVASCFNAEEGQKLLTKTGVKHGDLARVMTTKQRAIVGNLIMHSQAW